MRFLYSVLAFKLCLVSIKGAEQYSLRSGSSYEERNLIAVDSKRGRVKDAIQKYIDYMKEKEAAGQIDQIPPFDGIQGVEGKELSLVNGLFYETALPRQLEYFDYCPATRYIQWSFLEEMAGPAFSIAASQGLSYNSFSWNSFASDLETYSWDNVQSSAPGVLLSAELMGYSEDTWDCCVNHYENYDWEEFLDGNEDVKLALEILGYHKGTWESTSIEDNRSWSDLTEFQQAAAQYICYEEPSWNEDTLPWMPTNPSTPKDASFTAPAVNYKDWSDLSILEKANAVKLGYNDDTWDEYGGTAQYLSFSDLKPEWQTAARALGYDEETWDCYVNHYMDYSFSEIQDDDDPKFALAFKVLGWTPEGWDSTSTKDDSLTQFKTWDELTELEQAAAEYICYTREEWNSRLGVSNEEEDFDTCPSGRYINWGALEVLAGPSYVTAASKGLFYSQNRWDAFDNPIEDLDWESLMVSAPGTLHSLSAMNYNEDTWDCCVHHYDNFDYYELLSEGYSEVVDALQILGYDAVKWDSGYEEDRDWSELTEFEQTAAEYLCYSEPLWNGDPLPWNVKRATPAKDANEACPEIDTKTWDELTKQQRFSAQILKYDRETWDSDEGNSVTSLSWDSLSDRMRVAGEALGYREETWDCCVNHYEDYTFLEITLFNDEKFKLSFNILGWSANAWESVTDRDDPDAEDKEWDELTPLQQAAARYQCYTPETW